MMRDHNKSTFVLYLLFRTKVCKTYFRMYVRKYSTTTFVRTKVPSKVRTYFRTTYNS